MIKSIIDSWNENIPKIKAEVIKELQREDNYNITYKSLFEIVLKHLTIEHWGIKEKFKKNIIEIDFGEYQGTLMYVFVVDTYQPVISETFYTFIEYGSCCGCDTLLGVLSDINFLEEEDNKEEKINIAANDIMHLLLHMVQRIKNLGEEQ